MTITHYWLRLIDESSPWHEVSAAVPCLVKWSHCTGHRTYLPPYCLLLTWQVENHLDRQFLDSVHPLSRHWWLHLIRHRYNRWATNSSRLDWIEQCPRQHSIGYTGDGFYRSEDPTNSIKVLEEMLQRKTIQRTKKTQNTHMHTHTK